VFLGFKLVPMAIRSSPSSSSSEEEEEEEEEHLDLRDSCVYVCKSAGRGPGTKWMPVNVHDSSAWVMHSGKPDAGT
jgi:hypothetical protein